MFAVTFYAPISGWTQTINNVPLKSIDAEYVQIVGTSRLFTNKVNIELDFGQENKYWDSKDLQIRDENNKKIDFNSMVDALDFMTAHGYEFVQAYAFSSEGSKNNVYHFLFRRKKS